MSVGTHYSSRQSNAGNAGIPAAPSPLDLAQLVRRCMGRIELVEKLLASFEERLPKEVGQIHEALAAGDVPRLARLVHQFKGTTANVSAPELHGIAVRMDEAAQRADLSVVVDRLHDIEQAWSRFQAARASSTVTSTRS